MSPGGLGAAHHWPTYLHAEEPFAFEGDRARSAHVRPLEIVARLRFVKSEGAVSTQNAD